MAAMSNFTLERDLLHPAQYQWSRESVAALIDLWNEGISATEIARKLGASKNAILGKVHRLGLPKRKSPIKIKPVLAPEPGPGIPLIEVNDKKCRWPLGGREERATRFCGDQVSFGKPFCPKHCGLAYTKKVPADG